MALVHADRVKQTSDTTGTGTYSLSGTVTGFRTFVSAIGDNNTCYYVATDGTDWEIGLGTVDDQATDTLARTRVIKSSNSDAAVSWGAGDKQIFVAPLAVSIRNAAPPKGYLWDLTMSNAADTANDITVAAGEATDESGEVVMILTGAITKQLDATWAVGTNAGGLNTGAKAANTWYEVHLIQRQDTGVVDVMFTTTANRATVPANYTHKRRIGWIRTDGSGNILQFTQVGDYFTFTTQVNDVSASLTATAAQVTLTVPPGAIARFRATAINTATVNGSMVVCFSEIVEGNVTPADSTGIGSLGLVDIIGSSAGHFELLVSASSQIEHDCSGAVSTFDISTFGWIDDRLKLKN